MTRSPTHQVLIVSLREAAWSRKAEHDSRLCLGHMLVVGRESYDEMIAHAKSGAPEEICGILGGRHDAETSQVTSVFRTANAATAPRYEYKIDPSEQFDVMETIEANGSEVAGFYHSHPNGPPGPSQTDASRATWPGLSYVIVSLDGQYPYVGAWRWNDEVDRFEQEVLRLTTTV